MNIGWRSEPGSSVGPSSKVSSSSPERQDVYTKMLVIVPNAHTHTHTHTHSHSVFTLTVQSGALASEECLSQSVPSRCVSIDNGCVKYYNKQNSTMVLACQQLPYFNHVCRLLAEMENFPPETKATLLFSSVIEQYNCRVSRSYAASKRRPLPLISLIKQGMAYVV